MTTMVVARDEGKGHPLVLLHGFPGNSADWTAVADRLVHGHRVIVPDLLGFGASDRPAAFTDLWADAQAEALVAALDARAVGHFALVGHDYGGPVALRLLAGHPERVTHLVLTATNARTDAPVDFPLSMPRRPVSGVLVEPLFFSRPALRGMGAMGSGTKSIRPAANDPGEARSIRTIFATVLRDLPGHYRQIEATLGAIDIPTLVVWGDRDPFFSVNLGERTAAAIPGAHFTVYEGAGHFIPIERPEELAAGISSLLDD